MKVKNISSTNYAGTNRSVNLPKGLNISPSFALFQDKYFVESKNGLSTPKSQSFFKKIGSAIQKLFKNKG